MNWEEKELRRRFLSYRLRSDADRSAFESKGSESKHLDSKRKRLEDSTGGVDRGGSKSLHFAQVMHRLHKFARRRHRW